MFALSAVPIVLNVEVPDRALTAAFQAAGAALAASYLPWSGPGDAPKHLAARPSALPSRESSSPPGARQSRTAAWPSPRGRGRPVGVLSDCVAARGLPASLSDRTHFRCSAATRRQCHRATPSFSPPSGASAPASTRRSPRLRSIRHSIIVTFWLRCCISVFPPPLPQGRQRFAPGPAAHDPHASACALVPLSSADLAVAYSPLSGFARSHQAAVQRRGQSQVGEPVPSTLVRTYLFFRSERRPKAGVSRKKGILNC